MSGSTVFVPRTLEPVQIDKMTVKLYPVVDSTMKPPERAHAFQINKTALSSTPDQFSWKSLTTLFGLPSTTQTGLAVDRCRGMSDTVQLEF